MPDQQDQELYFRQLPDNGDDALTKAQFRAQLLSRIEQTADLADKYGHEARQFLISVNAAGIAGVIAYRTVDHLSVCAKLMLHLALGSFCLGLVMMGVVLAINFFSFKAHHGTCDAATMQFLGEQGQGNPLSWHQLTKAYGDSENALKRLASRATRLAIASALALIIGIVLIVGASFS